MSTFDHRPFNTVLIPWVIALVTLIGLTALVPDQARVRKIGSSGELELSQLADDATPVGRTSSSQVFLAPHLKDVTGALCTSSGLILIEQHQGQTVFRSKEGAIRGRAPPARRLA